MHLNTQQQQQQQQRQQQHAFQYDAPSQDRADGDQAQPRTISEGSPLHSKSKQKGGVRLVDQHSRQADRQHGMHKAAAVASRPHQVTGHQRPVVQHSDWTPSQTEALGTVEQGPMSLANTHKVLVQGQQQQLDSVRRLDGILSLVAPSQGGLLQTLESLQQQPVLWEGLTVYPADCYMT